MANSPGNVINYNSDIVKKIFNNKKSFHKQQARLPIEQKIKILVELQKIALTTKPGTAALENKQAWKL